MENILGSQIQDRVVETMDLMDNTTTIRGVEIMIGETEKHIDSSTNMVPMVTTVDGVGGHRDAEMMKDLSAWYHLLSPKFSNVFFLPSKYV